MHKNMKYMGLILALMLALWGCAGKPETTVPASRSAPQLRKGIQTLLVAWMDEFEPTGFQNGDRAEFLTLLVLDEEQEKIAALQLNPDTMVAFVPMGKTEPEQMPLGMVFTYGSGGSDSCI